MYVTVLGKPKAATLTIAEVPAKQGTAVTELGNASALAVKAEAGGTRIELPAKLMGEYAYSFKLAGYLR